MAIAGSVTGHSGISITSRLDANQLKPSPSWPGERRSIPDDRSRTEGTRRRFRRAMISHRATPGTAPANSSAGIGMASRLRNACSSWGVYRFDCVWLGKSIPQPRRFPHVVPLTHYSMQGGRSQGSTQPTTLCSCEPEVGYVSSCCPGLRRPRPAFGGKAMGPQRRRRLRR